VVPAYLLNNLGTVLAISLDAADGLSGRAFDILTRCEVLFHRSLFSGTLLPMVAVAFLNETSPAPLTLHRIGHFVLLAVRMHPGSFPPCCRFALRLLEFMSELCVSVFFECLCSDDPAMVPAQRWLESKRFASLVSAEILRGGDDCRVSHLLSLVRVCLRSPVLRRSFTSSWVFEAISRGIGTLPQWIEGERWETIIEFSEREKGGFSTGVFPIIIDRLMSGMEGADRAIVAMVRTLAVLLRTDARLLPLVSEYRVNAVMLQLMRKFAGNSFFQLAALDFLRAELIVEDLRREVTEQVVLPLMNASCDRECTPFSAAAFGLVVAAVDAGEADTGYREFLESRDGFWDLMEVGMKRKVLLARSGCGHSDGDV
jgi:hypothetical protein